MALKLVGKKQKYSTKEIAQMAEQYSEISKQIKLLEDSKKNLADRLKEASELVGVKDNKGSFYFDSGDYITGKVAKKSVKLNQESAISLLRDKGFYDSCVAVKQVEIINEKALSRLVEDGDISQKEFESICDIKTTYSVSVQKKEDMPEVDTSHCLQAASRKSK